MTNYTPNPDSVPAHVIGFFRLNPDETLGVGDIVEKFGTSKGGVHTQLRLAMDAGMVRREQDEDGDWFYRAGPALQSRTLPSIVEPAAPKPRKSVPLRPVDAAAFSIADDPMPARGLPRAGATKYLALFEALQVGQCIRCGTQTHTPENVATALRKWLQVTGRKGLRVRSCRPTSVADGIGRVWLLAGEDEARASRGKLRAAA